MNAKGDSITRELQKRTAEITDELRQTNDNLEGSLADLGKESKKALETALKQVDERISGVQETAEANLNATTSALEQQFNKKSDQIT